jgi:hypothetical protein
MSDILFNVSRQECHECHLEFQTADFQIAKEDSALLLSRAKEGIFMRDS